jgi:uncharacterized protein DUF6946
MIVSKRGKLISSVQDWRRLAPPKSDHHWVPGRSAYECAAAWFSGTALATPAEIEQLLHSHPDLASCDILELTPEHQIRFDRRRGEPRNADIAAHGKVPSGTVALTIEAKADEPFDRLVHEVLSDATDLMAHGGRTGISARVQDLASALLPTHRSATPRLGQLRYQLLTAVAGTLAYAQALKATKAVFIVHEFVTDRTTDVQHDLNTADLNAFIARLTDGGYQALAPGQLLGPITVPGIPLWEAPASLYVGKARRNLRRAAV